MSRLTFAAIMTFFLSLCNTCPCIAGQIWQPGFRTLGSWNPADSIRLDINIWYPSLRQSQELAFGIWKTRGALNAKPAQGLFPLLVISHSSFGNRFVYGNLGAWLAQRGFVVVAPQHSKDNMDNMEDLFTWAQLENRAREITRAIDLVLAEKDINQITDSGRIGLLAFGSGAVSALLLGGALPNCQNWTAYCDRVNDVYCGTSAREKISSICAQFPLRKSLADPRIKAIAVVGPGFGMLFDSSSFEHFYPPLLLAVPEKDTFNIPSRHGEHLARILGKKALFLDLPNADEGALMDECPDVIAQELPEMCFSLDKQARTALRLKLETALYSFFSHYLVEPDNLPSIPPPPNLQQESAKPAKTDNPPLQPKKHRRREK